MHHFSERKRKNRTKCNVYRQRLKDISASYLRYV